MDVSRRDFVKLGAAGAATAAIFTLPASAYAEESNQAFVDSLGRSVELIRPVRAVMPLGEVAQCLVVTLCPDALASVVSEVAEEDATEFSDSGLEDITELPLTGGGRFGSIDEVNPVASRCVNADIMLDAGTPKKGLAEKLDRMQEEGETPCIFIDVSFGNLPSAYRKLGQLLNLMDRAEELASFVESSLAKAASACPSGSEIRSVLYAPRRDGLEIKSSIEVQVDAINHIGACAVTSPYDLNNTVFGIEKAESEQIDLVVFDDLDALQKLADEESDMWNAWKDVSAIAIGSYIVSPALIYSWFGSLAHIQSIGVLWLAYALWPDSCGYDLNYCVKSYYQLFYGIEKTEGEITALIGL